MAERFGWGREAVATKQLVLYGVCMGRSACSDKSCGPLLPDRTPTASLSQWRCLSMSDTGGLVWKWIQTTQGLAVHAGITVGMRHGAPWDS